MQGHYCCSCNRAYNVRPPDGVCPQHHYEPLLDLATPEGRRLAYKFEDQEEARGARRWNTGGIYVGIALGILTIPFWFWLGLHLVDPWLALAGAPALIGIACGAIARKLYFGKKRSGLPGIRATRKRESMRADISDHMCVACNSTSLRSLGPNAYRCEDCGYEGGSGLQAMRQENRRRAFERMAPTERYRSAVQDLREARTLLLAVDGTIRNVRPWSPADLLDRDFESEAERQQVLFSVASEILRAQSCVKDALLKLGKGDTAVNDIDIDFPSLEFAFEEEEWTLDDIFSYTTNPIEKLEEHARALLLAVQSALRLVQVKGRPGASRVMSKSPKPPQR